MNETEACAQRWHDTDHGRDRKKARRSYGRTFRSEPDPGWVSHCWCCCEHCNPDWNLARPNPYWTMAQAEMRAR